MTMYSFKMTIHENLWKPMILRIMVLRRMWVWINILTAQAQKQNHINMMSKLALSCRYPRRMEWSGWKDSEKILHNAYINREGNGNYRAWVDHNEYEIGFCDGSTSKLTANIISEKVCFQVDSDGIHFLLSKGICEHRLDWCEIPKRFRFIVSNNGNNIPKRTTVG